MTRKQRKKVYASTVERMPIQQKSNFAEVLFMVWQLVVRADVPEIPLKPPAKRRLITSARKKLDPRR